MITRRSNTRCWPARRGRGRWSFSLAAILLLVSRASAGQVLHGRVVDAMSGEAVGRGFVVLVDTAGTEVGRMLSSADGRFTLAAPVPGIYRVRSEVIAYRRWESQPFSLSESQQLVVTLEISRVPTRLDAIRVFGDAVCPADDRNDELSEVWEEARKALAAASWSDRALALANQIHRYRYERYDATSRYDTDELWVASHIGAQPFVSVDPRQLSTAGYAMPMESGDWEYFGPDADVLLHESFQSTHCFTLERGRGTRRSMTGLAFAPVPSRRRPDIEGTLWIDTETAELREIEFHYTGLPFARGDRRIGGNVHFSPVRSGAWILSAWELRMPIVRKVYDVRAEEARDHVLGVVETGGETIEVRSESGVLEYEAPNLATLHGVVVDSLGRPVDGLDVLVGRTGYATTTDSNGVFVLRTLLEGKYAVTTPLLDSLFYEPGLGDARFEAGEPRTVTLSVPNARNVGRELCRGFGEDERAIVGILRTVTGEPLADTRIRAVWSLPEQTEIVTAETDDLGRFRICRFPSFATVSIESRDDRYVVESVEVTFESWGTVVQRGGIQSWHNLPYPVLRLDLIAAER